MGVLLEPSVKVPGRLQGRRVMRGSRNPVQRGLQLGAQLPAVACQP